MMLKLAASFLLLLALVSTSHAYVIQREDQVGTYMESVQAMCLRTNGKARTRKEIAACRLHEAVANNGNKIDGFLLPLNLS